MSITIDDIRELIELQLGKTGVLAQQRIVEDLGAESADVVNIIAALEEKYGVVIDEADIPGISTVSDLYELVRLLL